MLFASQAPEVTDQPQPERDDRPVERDPATGVFPNELGVAVSIPGAVMVFDQIAFAFDQYRVFAEGFMVMMRILQRNPTFDGFDRRIPHSLSGDPELVPAGGHLMLGLELSDGRKGYIDSLGVVDADFSLGMQGGGGTADAASYRLWVRAAPASEMVVHLSWPGGGLAEAQLRIDSRSLVDAANVDTTISGW